MPVQDLPEADLMASLKTLGCTNFKLRQLMRRVAQHYDLEIAGTGLKITQYSLLSHVLKLLIRPDEVSSGIANTPILKVGDNAFWRALEQSHMLVGSIA